MGFSYDDYLWGRLVYDHAVPSGGYGEDVARYFDYDWRGLPSQRADVFGGGFEPDFSTEYPAYDLQGNLLEMIYPSFHQVNYAYGPGGNLSSIAFEGAPLMDSFEYAAHGAVTRMQLHGPDGESAAWEQSFNNRNWPAGISVNNGSLS